MSFGFGANFQNYGKMSDQLDLYDFKKLKNSITVDFSSSLNYVNQRYVNSSKISYTIHVNNQCLKRWHVISRTRNVKLLEILNVFLGAKYGIQVKESCKRLEEQIRKRASEANSTLRGKKGRRYEEAKAAIRCIHIFSDEILNAREVNLELKGTIAKNQHLETQNKKLEQRCQHLYQEIIRIERSKNEVLEEQQKLLDTIDTLGKENEQLKKYVEQINELDGMRNTTKRVDQVKESQKRNKIKELKTNVERALWFAKTYGLKLSSATFRATHGDLGESYQLDYNEKQSTRKTFKDLSPSDQEKVQQIVYLTDRFCIGDAAYHELTLASGGEGLPRSYLIKQAKADLNSICHISRTPGEADGAELNFENELKEQLAKQVIITKTKTV